MRARWPFRKAQPVAVVPEPAPTPPAESEDAKRRRELAARFLSGEGFEIGAGLSPTPLPHARDVTFVDRRSHDELIALFGAPPPYVVLPPDEAARRHPAGRDFVVAHHVIEHSENPILTLIAWLRLLGERGTLFLSLPSNQHGCERDRLPTPLEHLLDDYFFARDEAAYESRQHIASFAAQWALYEPGTLWYAREGVETFARVCLSEARREGHDLHWHTYSLAVAEQMIAAAFHLAGAQLDWLHREEFDGTLYFVARRSPDRPEATPPDCLVAYRRRIARVIEQLAP
jgi:hypothetical protein